ncbi:RDD family protein [Arsenicicoccus dermatophilus]|uniref:RDD family protein n=1 Tax=Arsenicicoccus dermatophilus TaxID=1076331 RepID=UPI001F4CCBB8|nr:RDD family protein [Arsenicicoccus dermatophilus]
MVDREQIGSWLDGPGGQMAQGAYAGERLGLPPAGPGAMAPLGRRVLALLVDWLLCLAIAIGLFRMPIGATGARSFIPLAVLFVEYVLLVGTGGATLGHRLLGMQVRMAHGGPIGLIGAALRTLLLLLVIPPVVWDGDGRGLHDKAVGSVIVRTR